LRASAPGCYALRVAFIEARRLPDHVAIVMDGNGRWAEQRGIARSEGHRAGSRAVRTIVRAARRLGISALTLYAFSEQNWGRPGDEVTALMSLLEEYLRSEREELLDTKIRLRSIGDTRRLPKRVGAILRSVEQATEANAGLVLTLALSYGGREEIVQAARSLAASVARGDLTPDQITAEVFARAMPSVDYADPDLMIRCGGEYRLSNFLLWGAAYAELHFSPVLWPDYGADELFDAIAVYQQRQRRFGLTGSQVARGQNPGSGTDTESRERAARTRS